MCCCFFFAVLLSFYALLVGTNSGNTGVGYVSGGLSVKINQSVSED